MERESILNEGWMTRLRDHDMPRAATRPVTMDWDRAQRGVIEATPETRLLLEAAPGCGKTAVACARVAHLITEYGLAAPRVLLISFTRTAVAEMRQRIKGLANDDPNVRGVRITTVDSEAWQCCHGYSQTEMRQLFGSYEANIDQFSAMLKQPNDALAEHIERLQHVIIDEAQDLTGARAELIETLIQQLSPTCGVTVFFDSVQAIYGFTTDDQEEDARPQKDSVAGVSFLDCLDRPPLSSFKRQELIRVYRTRSASLRKIIALRNDVRYADAQPAACREQVEAELRNLSNGSLESIDKQELSDRTDVLVLYRTRCEALMASAFLSSERVQHRLRMSGLPPMVVPWIGWLLGTFTERSLSRPAFENLWTAKVAAAPQLFSNVDRERAWTLLHHAAPHRAHSVDMDLLRSVLSRSRPPVEFCIDECGWAGPIVGTIHASKGREADTVHLMLPRFNPEASNDHLTGEESRVLYVGATRSRKQLWVGTGYHCGPYSRKLASGRTYRVFGQGAKASVEIGRQDDVNLASVVRIDGEYGPNDIERRQKSLTHWSELCDEAKAVARPDSEYRYRVVGIVRGQPTMLCDLNIKVNQDLWQVANELARNGKRSGKLKPPELLPHLNVIGVRTVALVDDDHSTDLHPVYAQSRIFLAPIVMGFPALFFPSWSRGRR